MGIGHGDSYWKTQAEAVIEAVENVIDNWNIIPSNKPGLSIWEYRDLLKEKLRELL